MPFIGNAGQFSNIYEKNYETTTLYVVEGDAVYQAYNPDDSHYKLITNLQEITDVGNVTSNTVQFSNAITGFVTTSNIGIANSTPVHTLDIGSNVFIDDVGQKKISTTGTIHADEYTGSTVTVTDSVTTRDVIADRVFPKTNGFIQFTSNVGILNTAPTHTLDIGANVQIDEYGSNTFWTSGNVHANIYTGSEIQLSGVIRATDFILTGGSFSSNVGIGTTSPEYKLHVYGDADGIDLGPIAAMGFSDSGVSFCGIKVGQKVSVPYSRTALSVEDSGVSILHADGYNQRVGIGTATPSYPLTVTGSAGSMPAMKYFNSGSTNLQSGDGDAITIYAAGNIYASGLIAASDKRIKKNIVDADDAECLETLRLLKPKKYEYRDVVARGEEPVWGFIAQEVRETLQYATQLGPDVIPNIYELANVSSSNVITFVNFNTSNLESNATTLIRTKGIDGQDHDIHLAEVIDEHTIRVEEDLSAWIGSVDETGNVVSGNQLFVYGQEVDDFVFVKKEAIWTVATSALQEIDRQQQADKLRIAELERQLASVLTRLDA
jgi:hypothetical protein